MIIGKSGSKSVSLDLEKLVVSRMLLQANSGAGKSWALRRILEITHGKIQHIVLDLDGEFYTLREKYDYLLFGGDDGDAALTVRSAALVARRLLEMNTSAILAFDDLKKKERFIFVARFLEALIAAPKRLWHPAIIVVDEAHVFAPQKGKAPESLEPVVELMSRGRKRGFCGLLATQRLSKLHNDAAAEANNYIIGRAALDRDQERAADTLGFSTKARREELRNLEPGHFFCFGPALTKKVTEVKMGPVRTTHPEPGQLMPPAAPAKGKIRKLLSELEDLPEQAEQEIKDLGAAKAEINRLRREAAQLKRGAKKEVVEKVKTEIKRVEVPVIRAAELKRLERVVEKAGKIRDEIYSGAQTFATAARTLGEKAQEITGKSEAARPSRKTPIRFDSGKTKKVRVSQPPPSENGSLNKAEQRVLNSLAWWCALSVTPNRHQTAFVAGYTTNGHFYNTLGSLKSKGLAEYPETGFVEITEAGVELATMPNAPATEEEFHELVFKIVKGPAQKLLTSLIAYWPDSLSRAELAEECGYTLNGHFYNMMGSLKTLGVATYPERGYVRAADLLFFQEDE